MAHTFEVMLTNFQAFQVYATKFSYFNVSQGYI